ncbi:hypothetical protein BGP75_22230 [Motiliproteus sp. MSK22-1]|nr:hypothetical protein BGP75_22230 [Motiliproteus sp. MSK22-1]
MDLQRFMDDDNNQDLIELGTRSPNRQHRYFFQHRFTKKSLWITKHGIYTRLQVLLNDPIFQKLISGVDTIHLEKLIAEKKIIIFKLTL